MIHDYHIFNKEIMQNLLVKIDIEKLCANFDAFSSRNGLLYLQKEVFKLKVLNDRKKKVAPDVIE